MEKSNGLVVLFAAVIVLVVIGLPLLAVQRDELATRKAEAQAQQAWALVQQLQARNESALYEAAGYSIKTQASLVDYYARRGDRVLTVIALLLVYAIERKYPRRAK